MATKRDIATPTSNKEKVHAILQRQVNHEFENERLYLDMAMWCVTNGYTETGKFFSDHSSEERKHAMDFTNFMLERKLAPRAEQLADIKQEYSNMEDLLLTAIKREVETTKYIGEIYAMAEEDYPIMHTIAQKYLEEQLEEEQLFVSLHNLYKLCEGSAKIDFEMEVMRLKTCDKYKIGKL